MRVSTHRLLEAAFPHHRYYGWAIVAVCFVCGALSGPGQSYALGLYFDSFVADLGVSRVSVASTYAWATLAAAMALPVLGRLADRTSSRLFLGAVIVGMGATLIALANARTIVGLGLGLFCLRLLGQGAIGLGTLTCVLRWFSRYRGRAVAIAALGYAFGEFTMPKLITTLQAELGWRGSAAAVGAAYLACAPLLGLVLRPPPPKPQLSQVLLAPDTPSIGASTAVRLPEFWGLLALVTISPMVLTGLLLHQAAIFRAAAWNLADVASALQAYAVANLTATYVTGLLLERIPSRFGIVAAMSMLAGALGIPLMGLSNVVAPLAFGALLGAGAGATSATNGVIWAEYFGIESIGAIKGLVSAVRNGATAAGAVAFAALGEGGGYLAPLVAALIVAATGAIGGALIPPATRRWNGPNLALTGAESTRT